MRYHVYVAAAVVLHASAISAQAGKSQFDSGRARLEQNDADAAIPLLEHAVQSDSTNAPYHFWLGVAYGTKAKDGNVFVKMKYAGRVRAEFERAAMLDPDYYEPHSGLYQFYAQAPGIMGGGADKAARERAIMLRLRPYTAAMQFAIEDVQRKRYEAGITALTTLARTYPDSGAIPAEIAIAYTDQRRYTDAWSVLDSARKRIPLDPSLAYAVGRTAAASATRLAEGAEGISRYLASGSLPIPALADAHYWLGMIRERQGDRNLARAEYGAALKSDPALASARAALARLGS